MNEKIYSKNDLGLEKKEISCVLTLNHKEFDSLLKINHLEVLESPNKEEGQLHLVCSNNQKEFGMAEVSSKGYKVSVYS